MSLVSWAVDLVSSAVNMGSTASAAALPKTPKKQQTAPPSSSNRAVKRLSTRLRDRKAPAVGRPAANKRRRRSEPLARVGASRTTTKTGRQVVAVKRLQVNPCFKSYSGE